MKTRLLTALFLVLGTSLSACGLATPQASQLRAPMRAAGYEDPNAHEGQLALPDRFAEVENQQGDRLFRGGQPTDAHYRILLQEGVPSKRDPRRKIRIKTIVNLLAANKQAEIDHELELAKAVGAKVLNLPLPWGVEPPVEMVQRFFDTLLEARRQQTGVYVHCTHGRDRTGTMIAAYRIAMEGVSPEAALAEMQGAPFHYDPLPYPWMTTFVQHFDRSLYQLPSPAKVAL